MMVRFIFLRIISGAHNGSQLECRSTLVSHEASKRKTVNVLKPYSNKKPSFVFTMNLYFYKTNDVILTAIN
jgi:hypothetical protein